MTHLKRIKGHRFECLSEGFVMLMDIMGTDYSILEAARTSYDVEGGSTRQSSSDEDLLRYLMRHRHTTPFEMVELKFLVRVPMDAWRQWIRHRTANVNEYSTRYSHAIDVMDKTDPKEWRTQAKSNKQGSGDYLADDAWPQDFTTRGGLTAGEYLSKREKYLQEHAKQVYEERLKFGVAKEQARKDLPLSNYTQAVWKIDLHNLLHFLSLRMDPHAQKEIRDYAVIIGEEIVKYLLPMTWGAFVDYRLEAMILSKRDIQILKEILRRFDVLSLTEAIVKGVADSSGSPWAGKAKCRERDEFLSKIQRLGILKE